MKTHTFNKSGVLYWLATRPGAMAEHRQADICMYIRRIIMGIGVMALAIVAGIIMLIVPPAWTIGWAIAGIMHGFVWDLDVPILLMFGYALATAFLTVVYQFTQAKERREAKLQAMLEAGHIVPEKQPSAVGLWYRGFKSKTCFYINFQ